MEPTGLKISKLCRQPTPVSTYRTLDSMLETDAEQIFETTYDKHKQKEHFDAERKKEDRSGIKETSYLNFIPPDEFYDAAILYCENDYDNANDLMEIMKKEIILENNEHPKVELFDVISPSGQMFAHTELLLDKCFCIIFYLTESFFEDSVLKYQSNELLINLIQKQNLRKCQIMLLTNTPRPLPVGMKSLCVTKWYTHRELAMRKLTKILQNAQRLRKKNEKYYRNLRASSPDFSKFLPHSFDPLTSSPEISSPPIIYNVSYNVNATNVQIGEHSKMYGVASVSREQPCSKNPKSQPASDEVPSKDEINIVRNISEDNVHIVAPSGVPSQLVPDSTNSMKDISNANKMKENAYA